MRRITSLVFLIGLGCLLAAIFDGLPVGEQAMLTGAAIGGVAAEEVGAANFVGSVLLAYRGYDTLGELTILFTAATVAGLVLGRGGPTSTRDPESGFILTAGADLLFPLLLVVGLYIILHGHLTPGGGFQGGVVLAAAFFVPILARPSSGLDHATVSIIEGFAGAAFIAIGLLALFDGREFLTPLLGKGVLGELFSAGSLPLLYMAVGLKVGSELAGLLVSVSETEAID